MAKVLPSLLVLNSIGSSTLALVVMSMLDAKCSDLQGKMQVCTEIYQIFLLTLFNIVFFNIHDMLNLICSYFVMFSASFYSDGNAVQQ